MKKLLKLALMLSALSSALTAEILFDLHAQHFSNVADGNLEFGRYNLPKVYVSTAAKNYYGTYEQSDFTVDIKNPPASWSVTFDIHAKMQGDATHTLSFVSNTGKTILVTFKENKIIFGGYEQSVPGMNYAASISGTLTKEGNQVILHVNGYYERTATVSNFPKLKLVKIPTTGSCIMTALTVGSSN